MRKACLYRFFDANGQMLYVGKTITPLRRLADHIREKPDMNLVVHIELEWFDSEAEALDAETAAIFHGRPLWNKRDKPKPREREVSEFLPVVVLPEKSGPPEPGRTCVLTTSPKDLRDRTDWRSALRISRAGDIIQIDDVDVPEEFYRKAMAARNYVVHT